MRTPHLDAFAASGIRFARCYCAAPSCSPSRAALFTGRYPHTNGVMGLAHSTFAWDLHPGERHLAACLRDAGYATCAVGVVHETHRSPLALGYEEHVPQGYAAQATDAAIARLPGLRASGRPFYLYVGAIEPHRLGYPAAPGRTPGDSGFPGPHLEPDDVDGVQVPPYLMNTPGTRAEMAGLQGAVRHVDAQFGRLLAALEAEHLADETLVVFTTDHGIAMPRAKCSLYEPGLLVALILRLPGRAGWQGGGVRAEMTENIDLLPTVLEALEVTLPDGLQGRSLAPLLDGRAAAHRDLVFAEMTYHDYYDPRRSVRDARHKLIANFTTAPAFMDPSQQWRPVSDTVVPTNHATAYHPHLELYNLDEDPWEQRDLASDPAHAAARDRLAAQLYAHMLETADPLLLGAVVSPHHDAAVAALRSAAASAPGE